MNRQTAFLSFCHISFSERRDKEELELKADIKINKDDVYLVVHEEGTVAVLQGGVCVQHSVIGLHYGGGHLRVINKWPVFRSRDQY